VALAPRYYDYQARWVKPLGDGADLSLSLYGSDDELVLVGAPDLGPNTGGPTGTRSRTYFHRFNPRLHADRARRDSVADHLAHLRRRLHEHRDHRRSVGQLRRRAALISRTSALGIRVDASHRGRASRCALDRRRRAAG
jgi:hypothetical protein